MDLIGDHAEGVGYLLRERVGDVAAFIDAIERVAAGGSALDPQIVGPHARPAPRRRPARRSHSPASATCSPRWRRESRTSASPRRSS